MGVELGDARSIPGIVEPRPPMLCQGCSHRDLFDAILQALAPYPERHLFGDIGCYTLGALSPYNAISSCVDMGASITMAGLPMRTLPTVAAMASPLLSGITGLLDAVNDQSALTVIISDNGTTAMTGGQESSGYGKYGAICRGIGVEESHIREIVPIKRNFEENVKVLKEEFEYAGVSVIISSRECVQTAVKSRKHE